MKSVAFLVATCLKLVLAYHHVTEDVQFNDASKLPVQIAHDFIGEFGLVTPSDEDILDYADTVGIPNVDSELRRLYTDPALLLLEDDYGDVVAYYADEGIGRINAYPETRDALSSLVGASNIFALVYRPERFLIPSERKAVGSHFFYPANIKLRDIDNGFWEDIRVVDAAVVFRKPEISALFPSTGVTYSRFDIQKIPYAYELPVNLKLPDSDSPIWYHAIDSDYNPGYDTINSQIHEDPSDEFVPLHWGLLCHKRPWWCQKFIRPTADFNMPSTLSLAPETEPSFYRVLDTSYPFVKSKYYPLRDRNGFFLNPGQYKPDSFKSFKLHPYVESRTLKSTQHTAPSVQNPPLPLVPSKRISFTDTNSPAKDGIVDKNIPATDIPTVIPPYLIRPEQIKAATVPVLSTTNHAVVTSPVNNPIPPPAATQLVD